MSTRPKEMGIYADLAQKRAASYDVALEGRVRAWMEGIIGRKIPGNLREALMDGTILCELINRLSPGMIPRIHQSPIVMFRRENFGAFQNACVKLGCKDNETCVFEDVYDNRNMGLFLTNMVALARNVQYKPGYRGPILPDAAHQSEANRSHFTKEQIDRTACMPTKLDEANMQAQKAKDAGRYTSHGVLMNPQEHEYHGQKFKEDSSFYGPTGGAYSSVKAPPPSNAPRSGGLKPQQYTPPSSTPSYQQSKPAPSYQSKPSGGGLKPQQYTPPSSTPSYQQSKPAPSYQSKPAPSYQSKPAPSYQSKPAPSYQSKPAPSYQSKPAPSYQSKPTPSYQSKPSPQQECRSTAGGVNNLKNMYNRGTTNNNNKTENLGGRTVPNPPSSYNKPRAYIGTYQDEAMKQAEYAKQAGRYSEHGVIMNPHENEFHGQKWR
ncbi:Muscle-specific protein 20 [Histomonas meleagridis]|uniref:Muscle-specific protein 20 n=1 Tax=Histomonas meleagridis TaxID=135588 RepID=UPI00355A2664|nr:Muscle-specific protein 20 [Histomonas meleagridis]KAH0798726.1 Muscle-specific protein 20 [Histomonas meleagridis]